MSEGKRDSADVILELLFGYFIIGPLVMLALLGAVWLFGKVLP